MSVGVLIWLDQSQNVIQFEANRTDEAAPEDAPIILAWKSNGYKVTFRIINENEGSCYPGFKLYGLGRYKIEHDAGGEKIGTGMCRGFVMMASEVAHVIQNLAYFGFEVRCADAEFVTAAKRCADAKDIDDIRAVSTAMVERILENCRAIP